MLGVAERLGGPAESTLIGGRARVSAANAVLANATLAHGLDFDDTREDAIVHTGCVAVTTALAVGEAVGARGPAVLEALIAGVEVMCRVGLAVPGALHARHFHPTAITVELRRRRGGRASSTRLSEDQLVHAFGICGSQAGGIIEYLADGSWTKRLHPGWGAHAGVIATLAGPRGLHRARDRARGRARSLRGVRRRPRRAPGSRRCSPASATSGSWPSSRSSPTRAARSPSPTWTARSALREQHRVRPDDIVAIRCRTAAGPVPRLWEPLAAKHAPPNGYAAKFSLPYLLAVDPGARPGGAGRVHRRRRPRRRGAERGAAA